MTIVLARYKDSTGKTACISQEKYCASFQMTVSEPVEAGSPFHTVLFKSTYTSKKTARAAMNMHGENWKRVFPEKLRRCKG